MTWFFFDQKKMQQEQKSNMRNDKWLCVDLSDGPRVLYAKLPANMMHLGVARNESNAMLLQTFPQGRKVNADGYLEGLETVVRAWLDVVSSKRSYVFHKDTAPSHKSHMTQEWRRVTSKHARFKSRNE